MIAMLYLHGFPYPFMLFLYSILLTLHKEIMSISVELHEIIKLVKQNICPSCLIAFKPLDDFMFANGLRTTEERVNDFSTCVLSN